MATDAYSYSTTHYALPLPVPILFLGPSVRNAWQVWETTAYHTYMYLYTTPYLYTARLRGELDMLQMRENEPMVV